MQTQYIPKPISYDAPLPRCLKHDGYLAFCQLLRNILCSPVAVTPDNIMLQPALEIYGIGSGHRKENPPDVDFLLPNLRGCAALLVDYFQQNREFFDENKNRVDLLQQPDILNRSYFYAPHPVIWMILILSYYDVQIDAAYSKDRRHVIKLSWQDIKIDFVLQDQPWQHHANHSDFSMNTRYFCVKTWKIMYEFPNAWQDIEEKRLVFVRDIQAMLKSDITIFFRAIRFISAEGLALHEEDVLKIRNFFENNSRAVLSLNRDRLAREKELLFCSGYAESSISFLLHTGWMKYLYDSTFFFSEETRFLLAEIALLSDAFYKKQESISDIEQSVLDALKKLSLDQNVQQKLLLCLFDCVVYRELSHEIKPSFPKYSICNPKNPIVYNELRDQIALIEPIFENFLQELLKSRFASLLTMPSDADNGHTTDESSIRSETSTPAIISRKNSEEPIIEGNKSAETTEICHENIDDQNDVAEESGETPVSKKKKKRKKNKKKEKVPADHPGSAYIQALLKLHEGHYENAIEALQLLRQDEHFSCLLRALLIVWQNEINLMGFDAVKFPEKFLKLAILHYIFEMHQECINDYKMFVFLQFDRNFDVNYNSSSSPDISYLIFIFHLSLIALSRMEEAKNCFLEITLNPKASSVVKSKLKPATQDVIKGNFAQWVKKSDVGVDEYLSQADLCVSLGLYFVAISLYDLAFELTKASESGRADIAEKLLLCYVQFKWCEKAVPMLEYLNTWDNFQFVNNQNNHSILEKLNANIDDADLEPAVKWQLKGRFYMQVGLYTKAIDGFFQAMRCVNQLSIAHRDKEKLNRDLHRRLAITHFVLACLLSDDVVDLTKKKGCKEQEKNHYSQCLEAFKGCKEPVEIELKKVILQELRRCNDELHRLEKLITSNQAYFKSLKHSSNAAKKQNGRQRDSKHC